MLDFLNLFPFRGPIIFSHYWFYGGGWFKGLPGRYRFGGFGTVGSGSVGTGQGLVGNGQGLVGTGSGMVMTGINMAGTGIGTGSGDAGGSVGTVMGGQFP